jgi:hypothetical protein
MKSIGEEALGWAWLLWSVATTPTRLMTFAEFEQLPEPQGSRLELRNGEPTRATSEMETPHDGAPPPIAAVRRCRGIRDRRDGLTASDESLRSAQKPKPPGARFKPFAPNAGGARDDFQLLQRRSAVVGRLADPSIANRGRGLTLTATSTFCPPPPNAIPFTGGTSP